MAFLLPKFKDRKKHMDAVEKRCIAKLPNPLAEEPCSMKELREAIPKELFEFDMATSWYYIIKDLAQIAAVSAVSYYLLEGWGASSPPLLRQNPENPSFLIALLRLAVILLNALANGTTYFALWVIAHECGHQAYFGTLKKLNDAVGLVLHSAMLTPYHSWRITHGAHHKYTNNLQRDTAFPPALQAVVYASTYEAKAWSQWVPGLFYPLVGFPVYLLTNTAGQWYPGELTNHFNPWAPIFKKSERNDVIVSVIGFWIAVLALCIWVQSFGFWHMFQWYGLAYLVNNAWLVSVTLLQHHHPKLPYYDDSEFTFLKGALSTVDRDYGNFLKIPFLDLNVWMHHITDHHVTHHVFSTMPFYHARKATPYVVKKLGSTYTRDERALVTQFWEAIALRERSYLVWQRQPPRAEWKHLEPEFLKKD